MDNNPCVCFWSQELNMRRLLAVLRQTQSVCADNECYDALPLPGLTATGATSSMSDDLLMVGLIWLAIGLFFYMFRSSGIGNMKKVLKNTFNNDGDDNDGGPQGGMAPGVH